MAEAREIVLPVRIDQRLNAGEQFGRLVVVEHHRVEPEPCRLLQGLMAGRAAIDSDEQGCPLACQHRDRLGVRAIALDQPVGDVDARPRARLGEEAGEQRRRAGAVDVVVAEDRDLLAGYRRLRQPLGGTIHVAQNRRVRQEVSQFWLEMTQCFARQDAAPGQDAGQRIGHALDLRQRLGLCEAGGIEPVAPWASKRRMSDTEEKAILAGVHAPPLAQWRGLVNPWRITRAASGPRSPAR